MQRIKTRLASWRHVATGRRAPEVAGGGRLPRPRGTPWRESSASRGLALASCCCRPPDRAIGRLRGSPRQLRTCVRVRSSWSRTPRSASWRPRRCRCSSSCRPRWQRRRPRGRTTTAGEYITLWLQEALALGFEIQGSAHTRRFVAQSMSFVLSWLQARSFP